MSEIIVQFRRLLEIKPLWLLIYLLKAVMAIFLVMPFYATYDSVLSSSLFSKSLIEHWDLSVIVELLSDRGNALPALLMVLVVGVIIYMFIMQFINGGLYYVVVSRRFPPLNWRDFFAECGSGFSTNIKIMLMMMLVYTLLIPAGMFFIGIISVAGGHLIGKAALIFSVFRLAIMFIILLAASIFSDSVRAAASAYPERSFREVLKIGAEFFKPRLGKLLIIFLTTYIPFLLIWGVVELLSLHSVGRIGGAVGISLEFILFQIAAATRTGQKLWYLVILGNNFNKISPGRFVPLQAELRLDS